MREEFQSELIGGRIVRIGPAAYLPGRVAGEIVFSLHEYTRASGRGGAYSSQLVYAIPRLTSGRESFSLDASYYDGPHPSNRMSYVPHPPTSAVEARNQDDYHPGADGQYAAKRADYFEAGTLVVWDVDPIAETITSYRAGEQPPVVFRRGDVADAEPAVPGWRIAV